MMKIVSLLPQCERALCVNVNVTIKVKHCINGDGNANAENGSEPIIICVDICVAIDKMLNADGDANTDVECEQVFTHVP